MFVLISHRATPARKPSSASLSVREVENLGSFFNRQPGRKISASPASALTASWRGQTLQRLVQREQLVVVHCRLASSRPVEIESHPFGPGPPCARLFCGARCQSGCGAWPQRQRRKKMGAILPGRLFVTAEAKPRLVNQRGGLKRLARASRTSSARRVLRSSSYTSGSSRSAAWESPDSICCNMTVRSLTRKRILDFAAVKKLGIQNANGASHRFSTALALEFKLQLFRACGQACRTGVVPVSIFTNCARPR